MAKKAASKKEKRHMDRVSSLGCLIPNCYRPPEIHHIRAQTGMGARESHYKTLPLCFDHHNQQSRLPFGYAVHNGTKSFEARFGTQLELLQKVYDRLHELYPDEYKSNEVIDD